MLTFHFLSSTTKNLLFLIPKPPFLPTLLNHTKTMSISLSSHAFAGNPIRSRTPKPTSQFSPNSALESLKSRILNGVPNNSLTQLGSPYFKVLPFRKGRPLATSGEAEAAGPRWRLRWMGLGECVTLLGELSDDRFVYLGWRDTGKDCDGDGAVYWAIDVNEGDGEVIGNEKEKGWCFVELRTLMVATDWEDQSAMGELAIAGHVSVRVDGAILDLFPLLHSDSGSGSIFNHVLHLLYINIIPPSVQIDLYGVLGVTFGFRDEVLDAV